MRGRRFVTVALLAPVLSVLAASCGSTGLPTSGTATITWKPNPTLSTKAVAFAGTIGGDPVQGTAANPASLVPHLGRGSTLPKAVEIGHWTGTFRRQGLLGSGVLAGLPAVGVAGWLDRGRRKVRLAADPRYEHAEGALPEAGLPRHHRQTSHSGHDPVLSQWPRHGDVHLDGSGSGAMARSGVGPPTTLSGRVGDHRVAP